MIGITGVITWLMRVVRILCQAPGMLKTAFGGIGPLEAFIQETGGGGG